MPATEHYLEHFYRGKPIGADEWKILQLVEHWQYFISPTFAELGTHSGRVQRVNNWLRQVARWGNTSKRYLIYVVRWERGEIGDRPHCHLFIGGLKINNRISMLWVLRNSWKHGHNDVRFFDRGRLRQGANYIGGELYWR